MSAAVPHIPFMQEPLPRVLFVIAGTEEGSCMIFARRQAETLRRHGLDVPVFYLRSRTSPRILFSEWRRFRKELRIVRPHIIHAHFGTVTALFAAIAAQGVPLVITYRGSDLNPVAGTSGARLRARIGHVFSQAAALAAARIVCVSEQLTRRLLWRKERAVVLPSGVDPDIFRPEPRELARRRLGWNHDDIVVLFNSGNGAPVKRRDLAEAAVGCARRTRPSLRMEVMDGHCDPDLVPAVMNASDCLLVTSDYEGSPTVVQEALACNLPVVSVNVGDVAQRLAGVRATCIAPRDPQALAQALDAVLSLGARSDGRLKLNECSSHHVASELYAIYARIVKNARVAAKIGEIEPRIAEGTPAGGQRNL